MGHQTTKKIPHIYFENLDALRFLAAFSVLVFHFFADLKALYPSIELSKTFKIANVFANKGSLGVNFFFVLSGFLITYLILHERKYAGFFSYKKFLIRRTLRIWPLYFIVILIGFVLFPLIWDWYETAHNPWMYVFFLANFDEIIHGLNDSINFLTSPWSVAVEEQFYLVWGLAMFQVLHFKSAKPLHLVAGLYILSLVFVIMNVDNERVIYYHTLSVMQDLLMGCFIGISLFEGRRWLEKLKGLKKHWVVLIYIAGIGLCVAKNKIFFDQLVVFERFFLSAFFAFVILDQIRGEHSFFKFGKIKVFNYLGKISYGLYMYHLIVMYLAVLWIDSWEVQSFNLIFVYFGIAVAGTISIASISYYLIERPLLKLKKKYG